MFVNRSHERGQALPFWVFASLMMMTLLLCVMNYANTVRYQIRAQNAADSAAVAALASDAASLNSVQTLLLALNIQELNVRSVIGGVPQLLTGGDTKCGTSNGVLAAGCVTDLLAGVNDLQNSVSNLGKVIQTVNSFQGQLTGHNLANPTGTVQSFFSNNCVALSTDCNFKYTTAIRLVNGLPVVDEYACEKVNTLASAFLPKSQSVFYAVGHTSSTIAPLQQTLDPANNFGGLTNSVLTGNTKLFPSISGNALLGNFAGTSINSGYYAPTTIPSNATQSVKNIC
jgi:hypothetical protein